MTHAGALENASHFVLSDPSNRFAPTSCRAAADESGRGCESRGPRRRRRVARSCPLSEYSKYAIVVRVPYVPWVRSRRSTGRCLRSRALRRWVGRRRRGRRRRQCPRRPPAGLVQAARTIAGSTPARKRLLGVVGAAGSTLHVAPCISAAASLCRCRHAGVHTGAHMRASRHTRVRTRTRMRQQPTYIAKCATRNGLRATGVPLIIARQSSEARLPARLLSGMYRYI